MISISQLLAFEQLATESMQHDPLTCFELREVLGRCLTFDWETQTLTESIKMVVELVRSMRLVLIPWYPHLFRPFNDVLPYPFRIPWYNPLHVPGLPEALNLLNFVEVRFYNEPWKYRSFVRDFVVLHNRNAPANTIWDAITRIYILLGEAQDLLWLFCNFIA